MGLALFSCIGHHQNILGEREHTSSKGCCFHFHQGSNKGKSALLPDPPAPAVFQQLQSLAKQNPVCK